MTVNSKIFTDVIVSTDNHQIASIAESYGANIPFVRPKELAEDDSNELLSWKHAINSINRDFEIFVSLPCTSPLRNFETIKSMIKKYASVKCDMLLGVTQSNHIPDFNIISLSNTGLISKPHHSNKRITRRQDITNCYKITTYAYITSPDYIMNVSNLMDGSIYGYILDKKESIDIDDIYDFRFAEYLHMNKITYDD